MLINKDTLSEILKLEDLDEIFNKTFDLLGPFLGKYKVQELESIYNTPEEDQFRLDAKTIFSLLHHVFSNEILDKNGVVISKLFMGDDFEEIKVYAKKTFKKIDFFKPNSSRDNSRETYIHCNRLNT